MKNLNAPLDDTDSKKDEFVKSKKGKCHAELGSASNKIINL
jgi:hypothetical protein